MAAPHDKARYGEVWKPERVEAVRVEIEAVRPFVVISGGWAWHYMTPPHAEYKHAHDHKDGDLFIDPEQLRQVMNTLRDRGFEKQGTRFDGVTPNFYRYTKGQGTEEEVIFDLFVEKAPFVETGAGVRVVEPTFLLSLYGVKHGSEGCFSVQIARRLAAKGESPVDHPAMADYSEWVT